MSLTELLGLHMERAVLILGSRNYFEQLGIFFFPVL